MFSILECEESAAERFVKYIYVYYVKYIANLR